MEEALDLSFDRLLMMMIIYIYMYIYVCVCVCVCVCVYIYIYTRIIFRVTMEIFKIKKSVILCILHQCQKTTRYIQFPAVNSLPQKSSSEV